MSHDLKANKMILESTSALEISNNGSANCEKPNPTDLKEFLPWACKVLNLGIYLEISKDVQAAHIHEVASHRQKSNKQLTKNIMSSSAKSFASLNAPYQDTIEGHEDKVVRIVTIYGGNNLIQIKINKTRSLPREILAIMGLIIKFFPYLTSFHINSGANKYTIHEMCKFLPFSNITEINLDNTYIKEANYDTILDSKKLQVLSLSRCSLNDHVIERIASKLKYPLPNSYTLHVLNLSSNRLTDIGAKFLGEMLRTNRCLTYLNIADNMISDNGMEVILNALHKFPLTIEEKLLVRGNYVKYLRKRQDLVDGYIKKLQQNERPKNKDQAKNNNPNKKKTNFEILHQKSFSLACLAEPKKAFYEKAFWLALLECGEFDDPLKNDMFSSHNILYSNGNYTLSYLNIAYNGISHCSVDLLLNVLRHQRAPLKTSKGLINICLEGNPIPADTPELQEIANILSTGFVKEKLMNSGAKYKNSKSFPK